MKMLLFALIFAPYLFFAQNHRFVYEYKFVKDTLDNANVSTEIMNLDIMPGFSKFYSYSVYKNDSLAKADYDRQTALTGGFEEKSEYNKGAVKYTVVKLKPENSVLFFQRIGTIKFRVKDDRKIDWQTLPEKRKIENYICQKAITNFAGRNWTAWFTVEIPFQDGPYKFAGLPGLIIELYDSTESQHFNNWKPETIIKGNYKYKA